jgi:hypothetical protein
VDGQCRRPSESLVLPASIPDADSAHEFLELGDLANFVTPAADSGASRELLADELEIEQLELSAAVDRLRDPVRGRERAFYEFLLSWADESVNASSLRSLRESGASTRNAGWAAPDEGLFFPRQREFAYPETLDVPVTDLPAVEGLGELLTQAGVQPFEWRELLTGYVFKLLQDEGTDQTRREVALDALRGFYHDGQKSGGARAVRDEAGKVLLPACTADGQRLSLQPAKELYFPVGWGSSGQLEVLYGPFARPEFLGQRPPEESGEREGERKFLAWLGVAGSPRVDVAGPLSATATSLRPYTATLTRGDSTSGV